MFGRNARIIFILLLTVLHFLKNFANAEISIPMHFSLHHGCSGSACPYYILAEGIIKEDTPKKFLNFVKTVKEGKPTVYFNSSGGNLSAGLELGRAIRHLGLDTFVGGPYESFTGVKQPDKILVEQGICFSACAYAFLGGVTREIDTKGLFGLHQFRSQRSNKNDKGEASTQIAVALLAQYLDEMGIDRKVLDIASIIPSKDIQILPLHIAQALNVDNTNPPKGKWEIGTSNSGNLFASIVQKQPGKNALVCFYLVRSNQNFIATIVYIIRQNFRSEKYLEDRFNAAKSAYITIDRAHFTFSNINWRYVGSGEFSTQVILNMNVINALYSGLELEFDASFGSANRDFDPSITFSLDGLRSILAALLKQHG